MDPARQEVQADCIGRHRYRHKRGHGAYRGDDGRLMTLMTATRRKVGDERFEGKSTGSYIVPTDYFHYYYCHYGEGETGPEASRRCEGQRRTTQNQMAAVGP